METKLLERNEIQIIDSLSNIKNIDLCTELITNYDRNKEIEIARKISKLDSNSPNYDTTVEGFYDKYEHEIEEICQEILKNPNVLNEIDVEKQQQLAEQKAKEMALKAEKEERLKNIKDAQKQFYQKITNLYMTGSPYGRLFFQNPGDDELYIYRYTNELNEYLNTIEKGKDKKDLSIEGKLSTTAQTETLLKCIENYIKILNVPVSGKAKQSPKEQISSVGSNVESKKIKYTDEQLQFMEIFDYTINSAGSIEEKAKIIKQSLKQKIVPVTAISYQLSKIDNQFNKSHEGILSLFSSGDYKGLIDTKATPVSLIRGKDVFLFSNGKLSVDDMEKFKNSFMKNLWANVQNNKKLGNGKEQVDTSNSMLNAVYYKGLRPKDINQLLISQEEVIINDRRCPLGQELGGLDILDLWDFRDPTFKSLPLNALSLTLPFVKLAIEQLNLHNKKSDDDPGKTFSFWAFKHFKRLQRLIIGSFEITRETINSYNYAVINQDKWNRDRKEILDIALRPSYPSTVERKSTPESVGLINKVKNGLFGGRAIIGNNNEKLKKKLKNDWKNTSKNHAYKDHSSGIKGAARGIARNPVYRFITFPLRLVGKPIGFLFGFLFGRR